MFSPLYPLMKITFEPIFLLALLGAITAFYRSCRHGRLPGSVSVCWWMMFAMMFAIRCKFDNSSSRYFASMSIWIIVSAAYFCTAPLDENANRRSRLWLGRCACLLLLAAATVFCLMKSVRTASPYSGYIMKLAGAMAADAKHEDHVLFCAHKNLDRYRWYSGLNNGYHVAQLGIADIDAPGALRELVRQFRYYDGTVYIITKNRRKTDLDAEGLDLPPDHWRLLSGSFTNRHRIKQAQIYKLAGGDLLRHETSCRTKSPPLSNHDFEGAETKSGFVTAYPHTAAEIKNWPQGWIPYRAKSGRCTMGRKKEVMPGRGFSLVWSGQGEFEVYNAALIPDGPRELSFYVSGKPDSEYGIVMELFDAQNVYLGKRFLAHLRISGTAPEKIVVAIPPPAAPGGKFDPAYAKFRIGIMYYRGEVNIDDWELFQ